jgi:hypothetical protein
MANKKLKELLAGFPETARRLVVYEVLSFETRPSLEMLGANPAYADNLRFANPDFKEVERAILSRREAYLPEASDLRREYMDNDAVLYLEGLILKARRDPESLTSAQQRLTVSAIDSLRKLSKPGGRREQPSSYDAQVLSRGIQNS